MFADRPLPPLQKVQIFYTAKSVFVRQTVVCKFWTHKNFFDVCSQNAFRASVASFVADVEVFRRLDRQKGNMQILSFLQSM